MNFNNVIEVAPPAEPDNTGRIKPKYFSTKPCFMERTINEIVDHEGNSNISSATIYFPHYIRDVTILHTMRFKNENREHKVLAIQPQYDFKGRLQHTKVYIK